MAFGGCVTVGQDGIHAPTFAGEGAVFRGPAGGDHGLGEVPAGCGAADGDQTRFVAGLRGAGDDRAESLGRGSLRLERGVEIVQGGAAVPAVGVAHLWRGDTPKTDAQRAAGVGLRRGEAAEQGVAVQGDGVAGDALFLKQRLDQGAGLSRRGDEGQGEEQQSKDTRMTRSLTKDARRGSSRVSRSGGRGGHSGRRPGSARS